MQHILSAYKRVLKINEVLLKENEIYSNQLDLFYIDKNYISKQKVKDVIKEVKEKQENNKKYNISDWEDCDVHKEIICYLQDLLESEE